MMCRKKCLPLLGLIAFLFSCSSKQQLAVVTIPEYEFRQLDTMVVTARKESTTDDGIGDTSYELPVYHSSAQRANDLLHTRLELQFDWEKEQVLGRATLHLKPYFYPTQFVILDAKGFVFHQVGLKGENSPLDYKYDGHLLDINLGTSQVLI